MEGADTVHTPSVTNRKKSGSAHRGVGGAPHGGNEGPVYDNARVVVRAMKNRCLVEEYIVLDEVVRIPTDCNSQRELYT